MLNDDIELLQCYDDIAEAIKVECIFDIYVAIICDEVDDELDVDDDRHLH